MATGYFQGKPSRKLASTMFVAAGQARRRKKDKNYYIVISNFRFFVVTIREGVTKDQNFTVRA